jgi:beta-galactosidase
MRALLAQVLPAAGVSVTPADPAVELVTRTDGTTDYTFVLNHGRAQVTAPRIAGGRDLLTGADASAGLPLGAFGVAVVEHPTLPSTRPTR